MESSGPEGGKVRGPAAMIHERYLQLARDASSSGDRVLSENFLQHADHYFRLWRSTQPATPPPQQMNERYDEGAEGDEDSGGEGDGEDGEMAAEAGDQPDVEFPQGERPQQFDRDGGPRRRGRRNRYRPNEGEGGGEAREGGEREGAEARESRGEPRENRSEPREGRGEPRENRGEPREDRPPRRERQPREREENAGPEGFSSGPKPAFLRGGD
jgi:hypothetical protein